MVCDCARPMYLQFFTTPTALIPDSFSLSPNIQRESSLSWVWKLFSGQKEKTTSITIPKYTSDPLNEVNLAVALQYGTAQGIIPLQKFLKEFAAKVYQPNYADFTTLINTGNTDGWSRAVLTLCNPGEMFITEEWTYPSAVASSSPYNISPVPIAMDAEGMRADDLYKTLSEWDEVTRGAKRYVYTACYGLL
jgi:aromatic amino acid aminotransferase I / 2-aminoadipate transaminase